ncbi:DUF389 domain-containing protein [Rhizorhapis sp. SPR117]|uniref:DUF389 domain-containing protein n=1 Tax=Rhizorhapis sp. SPR117 TaxID=2912611 RepID=UPI001F1FEFD8|nr:DUF389 domain-containing protein [Rhizorhapis sp. SPR117]
MTGTTTPPSLWQAVIHPTRHWWKDNVLSQIDHRAVMDKVHDESGWTPRYAFMTLMSAGIAVLGLILSSPAVVIGAMLISPLMGPIIGLGFGLATGDSKEIRRTLASLSGGIFLAIFFTAFIVVLSPLQTVTAEIAARTRPNLFDLAVALFSALAGAYAMIRGREGTIVGVAIATALMPPLAVVGFGLATLNWTVFLGSLLLFFTNLMTIALSAAVMARLYGFGRRLSPRQTAMQSSFILATFILLAVPLGFSLRQIAWEAAASRQASDVISGTFDKRSRISQLDIDYNSDPIKVTASILTPDYKEQAEQSIERTLSRLFDRSIDVSVEQFRVGTDAGDAEAAQLAAAQVREQAQTAEREIARITRQIALVAGVTNDAITIDRNHKRAMVKAGQLPDAGLRTYYVLEQRIAKLEPKWAIMITPPALPLPTVAIQDDGALTPDGTKAFELANWAALRIGAPIGVSGPEDDAQRLVDMFKKAGVTAEYRNDDARRGIDLRLSWQAPKAEAE